MATMPARIPASAFASPRRRKPSLKAYNSVPPLKPWASMDFEPDAYIPPRVNQQNLSISHLREALNKLDTTMAGLMIKRRELETQLEQAVRSQSPVLRIPSELLSSIFIMGVLGMGDENPVMVPTLMLVCKYWAEVALNTPVLWAKISVSPHDSLEKARRRLERSKSCPLDVTVNFGARLESVSRVTEQVVHAMDLLRPALWRTKSLHISVPGRPQAHAALLHCKENAPTLENLTIHVHQSIQDEHYSAPPLPLFNGHTPRLRSCSFTSFNFGWDLRLLARLRVLKLGGYYNGNTPSTTTLMNILRQCPDLEELVLRNLSNVDASACPSRDTIEPPPVAKSLVLPRLTKLTFYYAGIALTRQILGQITFPSLESLELSYLEDIAPVIHLLYGQAMTKLPLRHLRIESCLFNEMKLANSLSIVPSITNLELVDVEDISSYFLKVLTVSHPCLLPRLESLSLEGCTSFDWDSLRSFVESRLPAHAHTYARQHSNSVPVLSSASAAAAAHARSQTHHRHHSNGNPALGPKRLRAIDVARCSQISKEMLQWLRMYVSDVKCESAKGVWGEHVMS
ncbi:hypothetical protein BDQ17DRAFT_1343029 [Cyathus striatus]|nr:hypothetical protein BDQ17DRAFT_1343029 [Cyathus striatus]